MKHSKYTHIHLIAVLCLFGAAVLSSCNQHAMTAMASESAQGTDGNSAQPDKYGSYEYSPPVDEALDHVVMQFTNNVLGPFLMNNPGLTPSSLYDSAVGSGSSEVAESHRDEGTSEQSTAAEGEFLDPFEESHTTTSPANEVEFSKMMQPSPKNTCVLGDEDVHNKIQATTTTQPAGASRSLGDQFEALQQGIPELASQAVELAVNNPRASMVVGMVGAGTVMTVLAAKRLFSKNKGKRNDKERKPEVVVVENKNNVEEVLSSTSTDTTSTRGSEVAEDEKKTSGSNQEVESIGGAQDKKNAKKNTKRSSKNKKPLRLNIAPLGPMHSLGA